MSQRDEEQEDTGHHQKDREGKRTAAAAALAISEKANKKSRRVSAAKGFANVFLQGMQKAARDMLKRYESTLDDTDGESDDEVQPIPTPTPLQVPSGVTLRDKISQVYPSFFPWAAELLDQLRQLDLHTYPGEPDQSIDVDQSLKSLLGVYLKRVEVFRKKMGGRDKKALFVPETSKLKPHMGVLKTPSVIKFLDDRYSVWDIEYRVDSSNKTFLGGEGWTKFVDAYGLEDGDWVLVEKECTSQNFLISSWKADGAETTERTPPNKRVSRSKATPATSTNTSTAEPLPVHGTWPHLAAAPAPLQSSGTHSGGSNSDLPPA